MVRILTTSTQTKLAQKLGTEPIIVVKIEWGGTIGTKYYSDKEFVLGALTIEKRLVSFGAINTQEKDTGIGTISSVNVVLDDLDSGIKDIIETVVPQSKKITAYHHFEGLAEADLVPIIRGRLSSPINWNEANRTFSFDIVSEIEGEMIGFAPDENDIPDICDSAKNKAWPIVFGAVRHLPAVRVICPPTGWLKTRATDFENSFYVDNGKNFPQNTPIEIVLGHGCIYEGSFNGELFTPTLANKPAYTNISVADRVVLLEDPDYTNARVLTLNCPASAIPNLAGKWCYILNFPAGIETVSRYNYCIKQEGKKCYFIRSWLDGSGDEIALSDFFPGTATPVTIAEACVDPRVEWGLYQEYRWGATLVSQFSGVVTLPQIIWRWSYVPKTIVRLRGVSNVYIADLTPGSTILEVRGKKTVKGFDEPQLVAIPEDWYTIDDAYVIGGKTVTAIIIPLSLEERTNQGWSGDVFVTVQSTLSPNTSDVIKYLIENYTELEVDTTSFDEVKTLIENYPSYFALTQAGDALKILQEIAWQARLGVRIEAGIVTLKYLSEEPVSADFTINESKIELGSIDLGFTDIDKVYTHITATWRPDLSGDSEKTSVYKNNIDLYGLKTLEKDFYIYHDESLVLKSLNFWGRRLSNIWRRAKLRSFLTTLSLELYDNLAFSLTDTTLIPPTGVRGVIDSVVHDPNSNGIDLECILESKAGTKVVSDEFWEDDSGDTPPDSPVEGITPETEDNQVLVQDSPTQYRQDPDTTDKEETEGSGGGISNLNVGTKEPTDVTDDTNTVQLRNILRIIDVGAGNFKLALDLDNLYVYSGAINLFAQLTDLFDLATVNGRTGLYLNVQNTKFRFGDKYTAIYDIVTIPTSTGVMTIKTTAKFTDGVNIGEYGFKWYDGKFYSQLGWFA